MKGKLIRAMLVMMVGAAAAGSVAAQEKLRIGKSVPFAWTFTPIEVGIETGIFKKHGLTLEVAGFGGDARMQQALAANGVDIGFGSGPGLAFTAKGAPVKGIAAMAGPPRSIAVVVNHAGPIKSIADLKGKKIGVTTVGSLTEWLAKRMSVIQGWGPDGVRVVAVGGLDPSRAALKTGEIEAVMMALEVGYAFEEKKEMRVLTSTAGFVEHFLTHVIFARNELIEKKPEAARAFLKGWFETIAFVRANKAKTVEISSKVLNLPESVISRTYDEEVGMFSSDGVFDPRAIAVLRQSFVEMKLLKEAPADSTMFTTQFVPVK